MNTKQNTISTKLEDFFLLLLRYTILFVLAVSILLSCYFAATGALDLQAKPNSYSFQKLESKEFINSLKVAPDQSESATETNNQNTELVKPQNKDNKAIKEEIAKQSKIAIDFYEKHGAKLNSGLLSEYLLKQTYRLSSIYGDDDAARMEYAKGQTKLFEASFLNPEINQLVEEDIKLNGVMDSNTDKPRVNRIGDKVFSFYPAFHENQIIEKKKFDDEQNNNAAMSRAGAMFKLYVAGGIFGVFLFISLILVLVKIERNLRFARIEPNN